MNEIELAQTTPPAYLANLPHVYEGEAGGKRPSAARISYPSMSTAVVPGNGSELTPPANLENPVRKLSGGRRQLPVLQRTLSNVRHLLGGRSEPSSTTQKSSTVDNTAPHSGYRKIRLGTASTIDMLSAADTMALASALEIDTGDTGAPLSAVRRQITDVLDRCNSMVFNAMCGSPNGYRHGQASYQGSNSPNNIALILERVSAVPLNEKEAAILIDAVKHLHLYVGYTNSRGGTAYIGLFFNAAENSIDNYQNLVTLVRGAGPSYRKAIALADVFAKLIYSPKESPVAFDFISGLSLGGGVTQAFKSRLAATPLDAKANAVRLSTKPPPMILFDPQLLSKKQMQMAGAPASGLAFNLNYPARPRKTLMARMKGLGGFNRKGLVEVQMTLRHDDGFKMRKDPASGRNLFSRLKQTLRPGSESAAEQPQNAEVQLGYATEPQSIFLFGYHVDLLQYERCLYRFLHPEDAQAAPA